MSKQKTKKRDETEYLLSSPKNAKRLMDGIKNLKDGKTVKYSLEELKANKEKVYEQIKKEAADPETQKYYKDNLDETDLNILEN
tara:strand:+ start:164 stop:415 length:252 start_codon:yes stop_codon:yes gene_type:complete